MPKLVEMVGKKYNRLTVSQKYSTDNRGEVLWKCICDCGNEIVALGGNIRSGGTKSCGCLNNERIGDLRRSHNMAKSRIFRIWTGIRKRCNNCKDKSYKHYGGRGINICKRWNIFLNFYNDMKDGYKDNLTIERINVNGNYEPINCIWATAKQQARNKRNNVLITFNGKSLTKSEWSDISGTGRDTIAWRIKKGWNTGEAIFKKPCY